MTGDPMDAPIPLVPTPTFSKPPSAAAPQAATPLAAPLTAPPTGPPPAAAPQAATPLAAPLTAPPTGPPPPPGTTLDHILGWADFALGVLGAVGPLVNPAAGPAVLLLTRLEGFVSSSVRAHEALTAKPFDLSLIDRELPTDLT